MINTVPQRRSPERCPLTGNRSCRRGLRHERPKCSVSALRSKLLRLAAYSSIAPERCPQPVYRRGSSRCTSSQLVCVRVSPRGYEPGSTLRRHRSVSKFCREASSSTSRRRALLARRRHDEHIGTAHLKQAAHGISQEPSPYPASTPATDDQQIRFQPPDVW